MCCTNERVLCCETKIEAVSCLFDFLNEKRGYQKYAGSALHPKTVVVKGIMADECAALMKEFFAAKRK